jgi:hypothetical protein
VRRWTRTTSSQKSDIDGDTDPEEVEELELLVKEAEKPLPKNTLPKKSKTQNCFNSSSL